MLPVCLTCLLTAAPAPLAIDLGETNIGHGLTVPSAGDGTTEPVTLAGRSGRRTIGQPGAYLYVLVDDAILPPGDHTVWLTVELYDDGPKLVGVQYDRVGEGGGQQAYASGPGLVLLGANRWVRRTVQLDRARLGNGQNHGADLRLAGRVVVGRLELSTTPPAGWSPEQPVPAAELAALTIHPPAGMELTFGNDCEPTSALLLRAFGVTSVESYVTWQTVEDAGREQWDWSRWDRQVAVLQQAGLKWVPFLIAGPAYATPRWFREGPQHHPYVCLEHGQPSKVESLWNPALRPEIDRFLAAFAKRYRDTGVIESLLLGITGIYGESIYPAGPEGGWTADIPGRYHNHQGFWAGDELARADFRRWLRARYERLDALNAAWGTGYPTFEALETFLPEQAPSPVARADFAQWYEQAMTDWSVWWVETTRRHFPTTPIYLCTGGNGTTSLGADFTAQTKAIAPFGAGVRITNEASDYARNFAITREVGTATRFYGTFCGFEPAGSVDAGGVVARVYNATAQGARQLHFYHPNVLGDSAAADNFRRVSGELRARTPAIPPVAVYLPRGAWAQEPARVNQDLDLVAQLRDLTDVDLVNHCSVADGILREHRLLVLPTAAWLEPPARWAIDAWVRGGGLLVTLDGDPDLLRLRPIEPPPARWRLLVGDERDGLFLAGDWHDREEGREFATPGARKRWSGPRPEIRVPCRPGRPLTVELEAYVPGHAVRSGPAIVRFNDRDIGRLDPQARVQRLTVPGEVVTESLGRLTLECSGWRPSETAGSTDNRLLGIAVTRVEVWSDEAAPVAVNEGLALGLDPAAIPLERQGDGYLARLPRATGDGLRLILRTLLGPLPERCGRPPLALDQEFDKVFATRLPEGLLWLNMNDHPVERGGRTIGPKSIVTTP